MPANFRVNVKGTQIDTDDIFLLRENFPLLDGGRIYAWGGNDYGELGLNNINITSTPTQMGTDPNWEYINSHGYKMLAIKSNGTLWAWGQNSVGELGDNTTISKSSPIQVGTQTDWRYLTNSFCDSVSYAIKTDGSLWAWGGNSIGEHGRNDTVPRSSPVQVGTLKKWVVISKGLGIQNDGTLWAWGRNDSGDLGLNNITNYSSPVQVGTQTNWKYVTRGGQGSVFAIKTDGTLWAWGSNTSGWLGLNDTVSRSSPVQVGTQTKWKKVIVGASSGAGVLALKTDGTLWAWGLGNFGQLGLNNRTNYSSPVQVGSLSDWKNIAVGWQNGGGIKTDGTLWTWGIRSQYFELGDPPAGSRSSPVQIGSETTWKSLIHRDTSYGFTAIKYD